MDVQEVLTALSFGERMAEDEGDELAQYFVETDEWRQVFHGDADIVYGPKGSGKSALYALLTRRVDELFDRGVLVVPGENVRGTPVFQGLVEDPASTEEDLRRMWHLYLLVPHWKRTSGFRDR